MYKTKNLPPQKWDERRLRNPAVPPKLASCDHDSGEAHSVPTNIGLSDNVENTAQTTKRGTWNEHLWRNGALRHLTHSSPLRLERELQLGSDECNSHRLPCTSLAASASLLSSVTAFHLVTDNYLRIDLRVKAKFTRSTNQGWTVT